MPEQDEAMGENDRRSARRRSGLRREGVIGRAPDFGPAESVLPDRRGVDVEGVVGRLAASSAGEEDTPIRE